jgi:hypothetical protein
MTGGIRALAIGAALAVTTSMMHPPGGWLMAPAHAKKDKRPGFAPETFLTAAPIATGAVRRFLVNPHGEVDALQLTDGTIVKFPPHMGRELTAAVKTTDTVSVRGYREAADIIKAFVITNDASKLQVVERPPMPEIAKMPKHLRFAALSRLKVSSKVERQMQGKKGEVNGVLLEDGTVVRFPPHVAFDFAALLQPGQALTAEGLGSETAFGRGLEATALGATAEALRPIYGQ